MRIGYLECFSGVSGDMLLGALVDAGVAESLLADTAAALGLNANLRFAPADRSGIVAQKAWVMVDGRDADAGGISNIHGHESAHIHEDSHSHDSDGVHTHAQAGSTSHSHTGDHDRKQEPSHAPGRTLPLIRELLRGAPIAEEARALALRAFELLGAAEASIHGVLLEEVHFHEVGAVDAIVDITCAAVGLTSLGVERWYCSAVNVGSGFVDCAHGRYPVPAPATASLLRGVPTYSEGPAMELVTPTGAALLRALDCDFSQPRAAFSVIGYGAGSRNPPRFPNVLRVSVGESLAPDGVLESDASHTAETVALVECAVDDLSPQVLAHTMQLALEHGALDAMSAAVVMKKGRLGTLLTILCRPEEAGSFEDLLFRETSTLGVRTRTEQRRTLERAHVVVATPYGEVRMKTAAGKGGRMHVQPEYEDCLRCARAHGVPLKQVLEAAMTAWSQQKETFAHAQA